MPAGLGETARGAAALEGARTAAEAEGACVAEAASAGVTSAGFTTGAGRLESEAAGANVVAGVAVGIC